MSRKGLPSSELRISFLMKVTGAMMLMGYSNAITEKPATRLNTLTDLNPAFYRSGFRIPQSVDDAQVRPSDDNLIGAARDILKLILKGGKSFPHPPVLR